MHHATPRATRHTIQPAAWQRRLLLAVASLTASSGLAWQALHSAQGADALPHPAEAWLLRCHGAAAFAALFAAGVMVGHHVPAAWRLRHHPRRAGQRASGLLLLAAWAATAFSGYALFYFAPEALRPALAWGHTGVGMLAIAAGLRHGRRPPPGPPHAGTGFGHR